jgi:redox-sensitive bicupin YhaK (pirin superfamily)
MIDLVIEARRRDLGGFDVGRVLPFAKHRMVGPFIFFDHMGPIEIAPERARSADVRPHPHIGLATVTYLFAGEIVHRDSIGSHQTIRPGDLNWMTAGRGIVHSERFERARREPEVVHGIQSWVALPDGVEETEPAFEHVDSSALPSRESDGAVLRLIAGEACGMRSPVRTHSPLFYLHLTLATGAHARIDVASPERAAYIVQGEVEVERERYAGGRMLVFQSGAPILVKALQPSVLMLLGGEPIGKRFVDWNFVSSSKERIEQAKAQWRAGRMKLPIGDDTEFIPLPA